MMSVRMSSVSLSTGLPSTHFSFFLEPGAITVRGGVEQPICAHQRTERLEIHPGGEGSVRDEGIYQMRGARTPERGAAARVAARASGLGLGVRTSKMRGDASEDDGEAQIGPRRPLLEWAA
jgi:hypothetical protein